MDIAGELVVYEHLHHYEAITLATGEAAWSYNAPACRPRDHEGIREAVVAILWCQSGTPRMVRLRAGDGSLAGSAALNGAHGAVVTADPPILRVSNGSVRNPHFTYTVFNADGTRRSTIRDKTAKGLLEATGINHAAHGHVDYPVVIAHGMLITATGPQRSPVSAVRRTNHIMAFDLDTGRTRWSRQLANDYTGRPFAASRAGVIALAGGTVEHPLHVVRLSWTDGTPTRLSGYYSNDRLDNVRYTRRLYWDASRLYGINTYGPGFGAVGVALR